MYNSYTEDQIKRIPQIGDIDVQRLPQYLTRVYAKIVSLRRQFVERRDLNVPELLEDIRMLRSLTNNLETILLTNPDHTEKESIAFVSATAHHLLLKIFSSEVLEVDDDHNIFSRSTISPQVSAIILFLIANSQADASEVANNFDQKTGGNIQRRLFHSIKNLAKGDITAIIRADEIKITDESDLEEQALNILWDYCIKGIKRLANRLVGNKDKDDVDYFNLVINLSVYNVQSFDHSSIFYGPLHLAKLLRLLERDILSRALINVPAPRGVDSILWEEFLKVMASTRPFLWQNHKQALDQRFLDIGVSAVVTFPTGAGKSTLSELKIASSILSSKIVLYIVPTHALEEQVGTNLKSIFNDFMFVPGFESDEEYVELPEIVATQIFVVTPERCLALMSINEEIFSNIGLVVFDEFHLVHGNDSGNDRRNVEAMFCLVSLISMASRADFLLISAMVENGSDISLWIAKALSRECIAFSSSWKPTRQMLGCLIFPEEKIKELQQDINATKKTGNTKTPPVRLKNRMLADSKVFFSLKNMWDTENEEDYYAADVLNNKIKLGIGSYWNLTSNRNEVAAQLAVNFAQLGIKTLVFVDNPRVALSASKRIATFMAGSNSQYDSFITSHRNLIDSLAMELGDIKYSFISTDGIVAVHHGGLLPLERRINELWFKMSHGLSVIVATATLAQGINLPAEAVIIAGDDRYDGGASARASIPPQELLNAAGRAGRAGMSSQGIVILIPGEIVTMDQNTISKKWWELKREIFSQSDQCLVIEDPLEHFLDCLQDPDAVLSLSQKSLLYRLKPEAVSGNQIRQFVNNSFFAFKKRQRNQEESLNRMIDNLIERRNSIDIAKIEDELVRNISIKTGINPTIVNWLSNYVMVNLEELSEAPIAEIVDWFLDLVCQDESTFGEIFNKTRTIVNFKKILDLDDESELTEIIERFDKIKAVLNLYIKGATYEAIERTFIGENSQIDTQLPNARTFVLKVVPDMSFAFGLLSMLIIERFKQIGVLKVSQDIRALASCIRGGFDLSDKLFFKINNGIDSRVESHLKYAEGNK